jgi:hypothetical protein
MKTNVTAKLQLNATIFFLYTRAILMWRIKMKHAKIHITWLINPQAPYQLSGAFGTLAKVLKRNVFVTENIHVKYEGLIINQSQYIGQC